MVDGASAQSFSDCIKNAPSLCSRWRTNRELPDESLQEYARALFSVQFAFATFPR
jgi:hypothetical protein